LQLTLAIAIISIYFDLKGPDDTKDRDDNYQTFVENLSLCIEELPNFFVQDDENKAIQFGISKLVDFINSAKEISSEVELSADHLINGLKLESHPEGGAYREIIRTPNYSVILFLVSNENNLVSSWHSLMNTEETWIYVSGDPLRIPRINANYKWVTEEVLENGGNNVTIPASEKDGEFGDWFGAYCDGKYSLILARCLPQFQLNKFKRANNDDVQFFLEMNPSYTDTINKLSPEN